MYLDVFVGIWVGVSTCVRGFVFICFSVLFTVNEVTMTMDVHVCCAHMQLCMWMRVLCVVCMGGCVCVYAFVVLYFSG